MPRENVVIVRPTSDAEVARSVVTSGNAGVYMSVANGGTALCRASVRISAVVTAWAVAARPVDTSVEKGGEESPRAVMTTPRRSAEQRLGPWQNGQHSNEVITELGHEATEKGRSLVVGDLSVFSECLRRVMSHGCSFLADGKLVRND